VTKKVQRDWVQPSHFKSKRDWLYLDRAIVREITRFGEKDFHIINHSQSFRELRRMKRVEKAQQRFEELRVDQSSVIGNALKPYDFILNYKPKITRDEIVDLLETSRRLENDVARLVFALSGSTGDINALWRIIETVGLIGRFMGTHPLKAREAANAREPWWHEPAISRAVEIRKKHPDPKKYRKNRIAGDIYRELKDKQDGPASVGAVNKVLERKLWTTGASPIK
jgi:hypothetical protein